MELRLRMGSKDGLAFQKFLAEGLTNSGPKNLQVRFEEAKQSGGGLAMSVPPEVVIFWGAVGGAFAKGLAEEMGKQVASYIWSRLKEFFATARDVPEEIDGAIGGTRFILHPRSTDQDPPNILTQLQPPTES